MRGRWRARDGGSLRDSESARGWGEGTLGCLADLGVGPWQSGAEGSGPGRGWSGCRAHVGRSSHGVPSAQSRPVAAGQTDTWEVTVQRDKSPRRSLIPPPSPPVPAEIHPGDLLLAVRLGDAGEHAVWAERAAQKPRGGPERGQLPAAPPALARGQPGRPAARHHRILRDVRAGGVGMAAAASACTRLRHPPIHLSIHPSIRLSIHPRVKLPVCCSPR